MVRCAIPPLRFDHDDDHDGRIGYLGNNATRDRPSLRSRRFCRFEELRPILPHGYAFAAKAQKAMPWAAALLEVNLRLFQTANGIEQCVISSTRNRLRGKHVIAL
jgi:hypothetical protein